MGMWIVWLVVAAVLGAAEGFAVALVARIIGGVGATIVALVATKMTTDRFDGREIVLTRYTQPEPELQLLIDRLMLTLPAQPPPKITAVALGKARSA